jgi:hypothetical protein
VNVAPRTAGAGVIHDAQIHGVVRWRPPDGRRVLQLALAVVWLLDGVLQLQPFFFTAGKNGFSGMLRGMAAGNPSVVARSVTWNASIVDHHAVAINTAFAFIQIFLGFGIAWRPYLKPALAASVAWSLGVWWFGEGLGGVLQGNGAPIAGGPGAVLFYGLLAVLLWPADRAGDAPPFAAARAVGVTAAKAVWAVVWVGLAYLSLIGSGRSPQGVYDVIDANRAGEPGWLGAIDRHAETLVSHHGLTVAVALTVLCLVIALGVFLPEPLHRSSIVLAIVIGAVIWVVGQNFGLLFPGSSTDPNSGPLLILLALAYWPLRAPRVSNSAAGADASTLVIPAGVV